MCGSQKVWLQLEEKRIPYTMEKINMRCYGDKSPEYLAKVELDAVLSVVVRVLLPPNDPQSSQQYLLSISKAPACNSGW